MILCVISPKGVFARTFSSAMEESREEAAVWDDIHRCEREKEMVLPIHERANVIM